MIKKIVLWLEDWCLKNNKQFIISDRDSEGLTTNQPYLVRSVVFQSWFFSIYIHRFLMSDLDTYHDHPWNFWTYVVSGKYKELQLIKKFDLTENESIFALSPKVILRNQGSLAYRDCLDSHRVEIDKSRSLSEINDAPLTLCLIGRRQRTWGFWVGSSIKRWIPENKFLKKNNKESHYALRKAD